MQCLWGIKYFLTVYRHGTPSKNLFWTRYVPSYVTVNTSSNVYKSSPILHSFQQSGLLASETMFLYQTECGHFRMGLKHNGTLRPGRTRPQSLSFVQRSKKHNFKRCGLTLIWEYTFNSTNDPDKHIVSKHGAPGKIVFWPVCFFSRPRVAGVALQTLLQFGRYHSSSAVFPAPQSLNSEI